MNRSLLIIVAFFLCVVTAQGKLNVGEAKIVEETGNPAIRSASGSDVFVGVSRASFDEQSARSDAVLDARKQILQSLEMKISTVQKVERMFVENQTGIVQSNERMDATTLSVFRGIISVKPDAFYIEKWQKRISKKDYRYEYKAWCLLRYSRAEHLKVVSETVSRMLETTEPVLERAEIEHHQGKTLAALAGMGQVRRLIDEMNAFPAVPFELKSRIKSLNDRLYRLTKNIEILVAVYEKIEGERNFAGQFQSRLVEELAGRGLMSVQSSFEWKDLDPRKVLYDPTVQKEICAEYDVDFFLLGMAEVPSINDTKAEYGIYSASMRAQLRLLDPSTGIVVWETTIPGEIVSNTANFANNPADAGLNALGLRKQCEIDRANPFGQVVNSILNSFEK